MPVKYNSLRFLSSCSTEGDEEFPVSPEQGWTKNKDTSLLRQVQYATNYNKVYESYLIIPPVTVPLTGSCHVLKRS